MPSLLCCSEVRDFRARILTRGAALPKVFLPQVLRPGTLLPDVLPSGPILSLLLPDLADLVLSDPDRRSGSQRGGGDCDRGDDPAPHRTGVDRRMRGEQCDRARDSRSGWSYAAT